MRMRALLTFAALALAACLAPAPARAVPSCTVTFTSVAFGTNFNILAGAAIDSTGTMTISCSNFGAGQNSKAVVCVALGNGANASGTQRRMAYLTNRLNYELYTDAARATRWTNLTASAPFWVLDATTPSASVSVYGRILPAQTTTPVNATGTQYLDTVAPAIVWTNFNGTAPACSTLVTTIPASSFQVTGTVSAFCTVSATNMNFGSQANFNADVLATSTITVTCTNNAGYWVGLDNGQNGTGPGARKMIRGAQTVTYSLYRDSARLNVWGSANPTDTLAGVGAATAQPLTVYGKVPSQPTPQAGTYTDTVIATVNF